MNLGNTDNRGKVLGHLACFTAYAIFGVNIVVCKDLTTSRLISPMALFLLRSFFAGAIFWLISLLRPAEKVELRDYPKIFAASLLGFFVTQLTFLVAIPDVTPMNCSILSALSPVYTMFIAAVAIKEPITFKKAGGVLLSLCGVIFLILNRTEAASGIEHSSAMGIVLMILNGLSFSLYLGLFKPLISKYSVVTFMKWIFLFSTLVSLPLAGKEVVTVSWSTIPSEFILELSFLIVFATFISYFLIPFGQKRLRPTLVSMYSYAQPIIATAISICIGMESLSWQKILSAAMVFAGVIIVNRSRSAADLSSSTGASGKRSSSN